MDESRLEQYHYECLDPHVGFEPEIRSWGMAHFFDSENSTKSKSPTANVIKT
jgi:hypothetical protein